MTKHRIVHCDNPDCPHEVLLKFSDWCREYLPDSYIGYMITDIDFILYNYKTKKVMIIELKTHNKKVEQWQHIFFENLNRWLRNGIDNGWTYLGVHLIQFLNTGFKDGWCKFDNKDTTEKQLQDKLNF